MKAFALFLCSIMFFPITMLGQTCNASNGNVVIVSNYDGGRINIVCDVNVPNLRIGVCSYEDCEVTINGPFAGNVTAVRCVGFQGDNDPCNYNITSTTVTGVPSNIVTTLFAPTATLPAANGNSSIICGYSCDTDNQGGCNTSPQIVAYFLNAFGGTLRNYYTQYGCWNNTNYAISSNTCCTNLPAPLTASFTVSDPLVCVGQCISFTSTTAGNPSSLTWNFAGAQTTTGTGTQVNSICYNTPGTFTATLNASNGTSSGSANATITVFPCGTPGCTYPTATNYNTSATVDDGSCVFDCETSTCPGDLTGDGFIGVADLLVFVALFGSNCPPE